MDVRQLQGYMRAVSADLSRFAPEVSREGATAILRLTRHDDADRWARISTSGELFVFSVDGDFYLMNPTVRPDDSEMMSEIDEPLVVAVAYLDGRCSRIDKAFPVVLVGTPTGPSVLQETLNVSIGRLFRRIFRQAERRMAGPEGLPS